MEKLENVRYFDENGKQVPTDKALKEREESRKKYETIAKKMKNLPQDEKMKLCDEIRKRCEVLLYLGDDGVGSVEVPDDELIDDNCWVMDSEHDDLGESEVGLINRK